MLMKNARAFARSSLDAGAYLFGPHKSLSAEPRLWILMYHRILPKSDPRYHCEEPGMVVEPDTFAMQMDMVREHFTMLPLSEWLNRRHNGQALPPKSCAITFDDGWLDNYEFAWPILRQKAIPATVFPVTHLIGTNDTFWPNKVAHLLDQRPDLLDRIPPLAGAPADCHRTGDRRESLAQLIAALKSYPDGQINEWLASLDSDINLPRSLMNWDELRTMIASGLIELGSHTCHHYRLGSELSADLVRREVTDSKRRLEIEIGRPPSLFCYPNGDYSRLAQQLVSSHYQAAVTTQRGINAAGKLKPFELLRIGVHEDRCNTAGRFASRLANWY